MQIQFLDVIYLKINLANIFYPLHSSGGRKTMTMKKCNKYVVLVIPLISLASFAYLKTAHGVENPYKYAKQDERFQKSAMHQFHTGLSQTINGLEQKSDNLEAMNQNLEGRINMLASEKDKLNKSYAQMKAKQSTMEKEQANLKKKATSLEVAYKKLSSKVHVATAPKKPKAVAKKTSSINTAQKKISTKPKSTAKKPIQKNAMSTKTATVEDTSPVQSYPTTVSAGKIPEDRTEETAGNLDIKKINEKGIEYGKKGMYSEAIREFQKVAAIEPNMPNVHYNLGLAYKKKGMITEAEKEFAEYERLK